MRSSSVLVALVTLTGVESRIEEQLERQHMIAPDSPTEVHEYYAPGIGVSAPDASQQQVSSDSDTPNERWFPFGGGASNYYESGDSKAPVENQEKAPEAAPPRPTAFLQQPSQEVHEYYAPWFGAPDQQAQTTESKSSGSETWFPIPASSASIRGDDAGLPEQGFHGEDVEHKDGETQTGDWGGEYKHPPEQSNKQQKASEATTQPPSAFMQEPTQQEHEYYAPWFGSPDVPQVQQDADTKDRGNARWFPFSAASASVFNEDKQ